MFMIEKILQNEEKQKLALEKLSQELQMNDKSICTLEAKMKQMLGERYSAHLQEEPQNEDENECQNQEIFDEVVNESQSLRLEQFQEKEFSTQEERIVHMLEQILENEERNSLVMENLKGAINENDEVIRNLELHLIKLVEAHNAQKIEGKHVSISVNTVNWYRTNHLGNTQLFSLQFSSSPPAIHPSRHRDHASSSAMLRSGYTEE
ncbi:hypothetical protein K7X08_021399 [Anisodus acutangulus]|uniref:Uncharacterized protein n=1 Tax=Anisodus acutangulus TaxID=402998 RepID=A0A9Q1R922_9SOLA|nr:hypothetical protein K7X08_021399 [Anisodus acutangulus]